MITDASTNEAGVAEADRLIPSSPPQSTSGVVAAAGSTEEEIINSNSNSKSSPDGSSSSSVGGSTSSPDDASDVAIAEKDDDEDELAATPGHLHALVNRSSPARLLPKVHSDGKLTALSPNTTTTIRRRSASNSRSVNSSRSSSPLRSSDYNIVIGREITSIPQPPPSLSSRSATTTKSNSNNNNNNNSNNNQSSAAASYTGSASASYYSTSSLDGKFFDPDLLLDRLGFIDLDPPLPHEIRCGPLAAPGSIDGKSNNAGGLTPVNERLSEETLDDCHAFNDLVYYCNNKDTLKDGNNNMSSTISMPSVAHSSLSGGFRSDMSVGSVSSALSMGSFTASKGGGGGAGGGGGGGASCGGGGGGGGHHSREGSLAGGSVMGDGEVSVLLGTLDEVGEEEEGSVG